MIEINDLHISYDGIKALKGVSLNVKPRQSIAVIGSNGSGKSTLLKGIAGIVNNQKGSIQFEGEDITCLSPLDHIKRSIVYLPQGIDVFPNLSVKENISVFANELSKINRKISVKDAYSFYPALWNKRKSLAGNLSGGERRLMALARCFMLKPKLLLLDEPSAGLSPAMLEIVACKIEDIIGYGTTIILVEQILPIAKRLTKCCYVLKNGTIHTSFPAKHLDEQNDRIREIFMLGKSFTTNCY